MRIQRSMILVSLFLILAMVVSCDQENNDWGDIGPNPQTLAVAKGATQSAADSVNVTTTQSTTISTTFTDSDAPGVGSFRVTFKIRDESDAETTIVNNELDGNGGLTITSNGGGSYTASYSYNPPSNKALGLYDLYFSVTNGTDTVVDGYGDNPNELKLVNNIAPSVVAGATGADTDTISRFGETTVISTDFSDIDDPNTNTFHVWFKILHESGTPEIVLVNDNNDIGSVGASAFGVTRNSAGQFTASFTYNPDNNAANAPSGAYSLYFEVHDGAGAIAVDDSTNNMSELTITD